jgi:ABC-type branched-subunit amino acid transport system ATPase component
VESIFEGFNGTIFAYGQTSSGKTFTMQGLIDDEVYQGIIPRINRQVFELIQERKNSQTEFTVTISMMEIYMERIKVC